MMTPEYQINNQMITVTNRSSTPQDRRSWRPQNGTTTDHENGDVIGVVGFFRHTHPKYPDRANNASVSDLNSLGRQEATAGRARRVDVSAPSPG